MVELEEERERERERESERRRRGGGGARAGAGAGLTRGRAESGTSDYGGASPPRTSTLLTSRLASAASSVSDAGGASDELHGGGGGDDDVPSLLRLTTAQIKEQIEYLETADLRGSDAAALHRDLMRAYFSKSEFHAGIVSLADLEVPDNVEIYVGLLDMKRIEFHLSTKSGPRSDFGLAALIQNNVTKIEILSNIFGSLATIGESILMLNDARLTLGGVREINILRPQNEFIGMIQRHYVSQVVAAVPSIIAGVGVIGTVSNLFGEVADAGFGVGFVLFCFVLFCFVLFCSVLFLDEI